GGHPRREVVAVGGGHGAVAKEIAIGVEEDGRLGGVFHAVHQLTLVLGPEVERLAKLHAAREDERGRGHARHAACSRRARGKCAGRAPGDSGGPVGPAITVIVSPVKTLRNGTPGPVVRAGDSVTLVSLQKSGPTGFSSPPRRASSRGTTVTTVGAPAAVRAKAQRCSACAPAVARP